MPEQQEMIFDPVNYYKTTLKNMHNDNVNKHLEQLIEKSKIDVSKNKTLVSQMNKLDQKLKTLNDSFNKIKLISRLINFSIVISALIILFSSISIYALSRFDGNQIKGYLISGFILAAFVILFIGLLILQLKKFRHLIRNRTLEIQKLTTQYNALYDEAMDGLKPLFNSFNSTDAPNIATKTTPIISLDEYFNNEKYEMLIDKYKLGEYDKSTSIISVQSGSLVGNPFVIHRRLRTKMQNTTYTGAITVYVTKHYTDSKGNRKSTTSSEILTASIVKPAPVFEEIQTLVYGNEAVPNLNYSRVPVGANSMNEKELAKFLNKSSKNLNKIADKAIKSGDSFNLLGNEEFESLFCALDRNDEIEFRMLFTPLAQKQLVNLIKDKEMGFGDDFSILKTRNLNFIKADSFARYNFNVEPNEFFYFDLEMVKQRFLERHNNYFKHIYFALAPILSTPLYQQHKPQEYIYPFKYKNNPSNWENESIANSYNQMAFAHPESNTQNILKTNVINEKDGKYKVEVTAYGNKGEPRVESVAVMASNGSMHIVPVHWTEYFPVSKKSDFYVKKTDNLLSNLDFENKITSDNSWGNFIKKNEIYTGFNLNRNRLFSFISANVQNLDDLDELD